MRKQVKVLAIASIALVAFGCDKNKDHAGRPPQIGCQNPRAVKLGDSHPVTVVQSEPGQPFSWEVSGTELKLTTGQAPSVQIIRDENYGAQSGECLTTPNYIRISRDKEAPTANSYLIAAPDVINSRDVKIGNYGPGAEQGAQGRFFIEKVPGVAGNSNVPEILYGDVFRIRGVARDWWLVVPANAADGTKVVLDQDVNKATRFTFPHP